MAIALACPRCASSVPATVEMAGKRVACPQCRTDVTLPRTLFELPSQAAETPSVPPPSGFRVGAVLPWVLGGGAVFFVFAVICLGPAALVYAMLRGDEDANHLAAEAKVLPAGVDLPEGAPKRAMRVTEFNGVFQVRSDLTGNDVVYKYQAGAANNNKRCKEYLVDLEAGKDYVIDLESNQFDAFLRLGQLNGAQIAVDDDSGGNLNSRIRFTPVESGTYVITATALNAGFGPFTLTVRETRFKKPR